MRFLFSTLARFSFLLVLLFIYPHEPICIMHCYNILGKITTNHLWCQKEALVLYFAMKFRFVYRSFKSPMCSSRWVTHLGLAYGRSRNPTITVRPGSRGSISLTLPLTVGISTILRHQTNPDLMMMSSVPQTSPRLYLWKAVRCV